MTPTTREELIEVMARGLAHKDGHADEDAVYYRKDATAALTALEEAGYRVEKTVEHKRAMTKQEFWEKWTPCDWPPLSPSSETEREFMDDLDAVISASPFRSKEDE